MILKGSQRAGARALASHLLNEKDNEHVRVHDLRGFATTDLTEAFCEAQAIAKGTKCRQFLFSLSLNPPQGAQAGEKDFDRAADAGEKALGLEGQPRAIVLHEKEGRRHAHVVWSRIDASTMRAINLPHFKRKLTSLSKELFLEHGWTLPEGLRRMGGKSPLNFSLAEWQQAKRLGKDPREIKDIFRQAWERSDTQTALADALAERGYFLATGDRRGLVALDLDGEVYAFAKWAGLKVREARAKPGEAAPPSIDTVRGEIASLVTDKLRGFAAAAKAKQAREIDTLRAGIATLQQKHARERADMAKRQEERWTLETQERADRLRAGLRGLWDAITGRARGIRKINEQESVRGLDRDREERDALVLAQLNARAPLQQRLSARRRAHVQERRIVTRELVEAMRRASPRQESPAPSRTRHRHRHRHRHPSLDR